jgi:hypothetical protein
MDHENGLLARRSLDDRLFTIRILGYFQRRQKAPVAGLCLATTPYVRKINDLGVCRRRPIFAKIP